MAIRNLFNFFGGRVQENPLAASATSMTNPAFIPLPAITAGQHAPIIFDPDGDDGGPFVKWITAHTLGSDTVTITATAQETWAGGGTERAVSFETPFVLGATQLDFPGQPGGMGLIGRTYYNPNETGGGGSTLYTTTSTTFVDVDATNLAVTFIVPPSGRVMVRLTATCYVAAAGFAHYWGLRESTTILTPQYNATQSTNVESKSAVLHVVSGLNPGDTKTWKWAYRVSGASTSGIRVGGSQVNDAAGAATMEVWTVNF